MEYISYFEILNGKNIKDCDLLVGRTKNAYLIGPKITNSFDIDSFVKRINSNCIYKSSIYKKHMRKKKVGTLIAMYYPLLKDNEIYELVGNVIKIHKVIPVPGDNYEKK